MRLTNYIRDEIVKAVIKHRFQAEANLLVQEEHVLANKTLDMQFTSDQLKLLNSLPTEWVGSCCTVHAKLHGGTITLALGKRRNAPAHMGYRMQGDDAEVMKFNIKRRAFEAARESAISALRGSLKKVSTTQTLAKTWPEIAKFIPEECKEPVKNTELAFPIETLNQMLRLP